MRHRFENMPEALVAQARHLLTEEQQAVVRGVARAQAGLGQRFSAGSIRRFCAEFQIPAAPVLRALGWSPGDADMLGGPVIMEQEDGPCTAGTALCEIANGAAR